MSNPARIKSKVEPHWSVVTTENELPEAYPQKSKPIDAKSAREKGEFSAQTQYAGQIGKTEFE
jgi:hypothetical protein